MTCLFGSHACQLQARGKHVRAILSSCWVRGNDREALCFRVPCLHCLLPCACSKDTPVHYGLQAVPQLLFSNPAAERAWIWYNYLVSKLRIQIGTGQFGQIAKKYCLCNVTVTCMINFPAPVLLDPNGSKPCRMMMGGNNTDLGFLGSHTVRV